MPGSTAKNVPLAVLVRTSDARVRADGLRAVGVDAFDDERDAGRATCVVVDGGTVRVAAAGGPGLAVLALTRTADRRDTTALLDAGAGGVALESDGAKALAAALHAVAAGYLIVPAAGRQAVRRPVFTPRQKQVLALLILGMSNADIAARLFVSESTVKMHISAIFVLLQVGSRKAAVDVILDPASGLGTGILRIAKDLRAQGGLRHPDGQVTWRRGWSTRRATTATAAPTPTATRLGAISRLGSPNARTPLRACTAAAMKKASTTKPPASGRIPTAGGRM